MNGVANENSSEVWGDVISLVGYVLRTPIWEGRCRTETMRLGRERQKARRKAKIDELKTNIKQAWQGE